MRNPVASRGKRSRRAKKAEGRPTIGQLPNTVLVSLDEGLARQAAAFGAQHKLRGADAVYLATASLFAAELVTLDREQLSRGARIVQTLTPAGFIAYVTKDLRFTFEYGPEPGMIALRNCGHHDVCEKRV